jgi:chromosome segregation protein
MKMTMVDWLRGGETADAPSQRMPLHTEREQRGGSTGDAPTADEILAQESQVGPRFVTVRSDIERFCASLSHEVSKFAMLHAKAEADHGQLNQRHAVLSKDHLRAREALTAAESQLATLQGEQSRLRKEISVLVGKLDSIKTDLQISHDSHAQLRLRYEALEAEHMTLDAECDRRGVALAELRQQLTDMFQNVEVGRMQIDQGRQRESELATEKLRLEAGIRDLRALMEDALQKTEQDQDKIGRLVAVLDAARIELDSRNCQITDCQGEKAELVAERDSLAIALEEHREASKVRQDALAATRDSLLDMSEKQRKQIEEQSTRISQLEAVNARLGRELLAAAPPAGSAETLHDDIRSPSTQRAKTRRKTPAALDENALVTPAGELFEEAVAAKPDKSRLVMA